MSLTGPAGDGGGLVADALEVTGNLHAAGDLPQIELAGLLGQQAKRDPVDLDFELVDGLVGLERLPGQGLVAVDVGTHRPGDHPLERGWP